MPLRKGSANLACVVSTGSFSVFKNATNRSRSTFVNGSRNGAPFGPLIWGGALRVGYVMFRADDVAAEYPLQ